MKNNIDVYTLYDRLIDWDLFTSEELELITKINGLTLETLSDCLFVRYGYDAEQFLEEMQEEEETEEDWEDEEDEEEE